MTDARAAASFRDPSGFVFTRNGEILRQINRVYLPDFHALSSSRLYDELVEAQLLIPHEVLDVPPADPRAAACVIRPEPIPFISYPYEWCFGQLRAAALATLEIQRKALRRGMTLKDASAFNVQFLKGRPVLIDTLSFARWEEGSPWPAYRQFCEHFLCPLLLIRDVDPRLTLLAAATVDGVPLDLTSRLLPRRSRLRPSVQLHIHLHARAIRHFGQRAVPNAVRRVGISRASLDRLIDALYGLVESLHWEPEVTEWSDYDTTHKYSAGAHTSKVRVVASILDRIRPRVVWDLGANTGDFSRVARSAGAAVVALDSDFSAVEIMYRRIVEEGETGIHPLWVDLRNPTPGHGWAGSERESLFARANADTVLALALLHHLVISGNVPLPLVADWMAKLAPRVIIEFVPKDDPQARRLLVSRQDVFADYSRDSFERHFGVFFDAGGVFPLPDSDRVIYHLIRKDA